MTDEDLRDAFRALRESHDGTHPEADATLQRALFRTRTRARRRSVARYVLLPAAAALFVSSAWAGATGRLQALASSVRDAMRDPTTEIAPPRPLTPTPPTAAPTPKPTETIELAPTPKPTETIEPAPTPPASSAPLRPTPVPALTPVPVPVPVPAPLSPPPTDPHANLFTEAHRLHFQERNAARALDAWDAYLAAAPDGRFVPEARYNRALALLRLGRNADAKRALDAFASGTFGDYHRDDARALLEALARDAQAE